MKKTITIIGVLLCILLFAGCGEKPPDLEDRIIEDVEDQNSYTGVIETIEIDIYQDGTHKIVTEDEEISIQSPKINLNNYIDKKVTVFGSMQRLIDDKSEVFIVEKITLEDSEGVGESGKYENKRFGFSFDYPDLWELFEDTDGLTLRSNGVNWVTIDIYNTEAELDEFVASYEIEDGTPVTIGGQRSLRYVESEEIRIYTPNISKAKIYKITFQELEDGGEAQKDLFYSFLESFTIFISKVKEGEKCGGEENITCPEDFRCELTSDEDEAEGICISVDDVSTDLDCPFVPAPSGCLNYEAKNLNRDGCPTSYECLDDPDDMKEASGDAVETGHDPSQKSEEVDDVISAFTKYQNKILPEGAEITQFEIIEEQSLLAAIYNLEEGKFRDLYTYEPSANEFNFVRKAHFEQGEDRDWVILEGEEIRILYDKEIIKVGSTASGTQVISSDMRLYENPHKDYSVQYPKNWYYRSFGSIENTVWTVGFAEESLDSIFDTLITLRILDESSAGKEETKGDQYLIEIPRDEDSHFLLEGSLELKETMDKMAETIVQN